MLGSLLLASHAQTALEPPAALEPVQEQPRSALGLKIYAFGLQKSGSTVMTVALAAGMGVTLSTESAQACCCGQDTSCYGNLTAQECADSTNIVAPLFGGSADTYVRQCGGLLRRTMLHKADDMMWQAESLMNGLGTALGVDMQYVYLVRHPLYNIRSLLSWCSPNMEDCTQTLQAELEKGGGNALYLRIFSKEADDGTSQLAATPLDLAETWKRAAQVYLNRNTRFASILRYEDVLTNPVLALTRVSDAIYKRHFGDSMTASAQLNATAIMRSLTGGNLTDEVGDYEHDDYINLFSDSVTEQILTMCAPEMEALGYTRDGIALNEDWRQRLNYPVVLTQDSSAGGVAAVARGASKVLSALTMALDAVAPDSRY